MSTIEKICCFVGVLMLMGCAMMNDTVAPHIRFIYIFVMIFFLTAGKAWVVFRK